MFLFLLPKAFWWEEQGKGRGVPNPQLCLHGCGEEASSTSTMSHVQLWMLHLFVLWRYNFFFQRFCKVKFLFWSQHMFWLMPQPFVWPLQMQSYICSKYAPWNIVFLHCDLEYTTFFLHKEINVFILKALHCFTLICLFFFPYQIVDLYFWLASVSN